MKSASITEDLINFYDKTFKELNHDFNYIRGVDYDLDLVDDDSNWILKRHVPVDLISGNDLLDVEKFKAWRKNLGRRRNY